MGQAMTVVILSSVAAGVGTISSVGVSGIFWGTISALVGWFIWAFLTYFIGTPDSSRASDPGRRGRAVADHRLLQLTRGSSSLGSVARSWWLGFLCHRGLDAGGDGHRRSPSAGLQKHGPGRGCLRAGLARAGSRSPPAFQHYRRLGTTGLIPPAFVSPAGLPAEGDSIPAAAWEPKPHLAMALRSFPRMGLEGGRRITRRYRGRGG